jgi:uncharacterized protein (TIGR03435 family)
VKGLGSILLAGAAVAWTFTQTPQGFAAALYGQSADRTTPTLDVVSIRINKNADATPSTRFRPDGAFTMTRVTVTSLLSVAFGDARGDMVGLPKWAFSDTFDVRTSVLQGRRTATVDDRRNMMRALLIERFKLTWHMGTREMPAYDLVFARSDRRLGPGLKKVGHDCDAMLAQRRAASQAAIAAGQIPPPPEPVSATGAIPQCRIREAGNRVEGEIPVSALPVVLRGLAARPVVDKTGLTGSYFLTLDASSAQLGTRGDTSGSPTPGTVPSIFVAVQEQLGLKLVSSRAQLPALFIDRLERPTEN